MQVGKGERNVKGRYVWTNSLLIDNKTIITTGKLFKLTRIKEEWYEDVEDPESFIEEFKRAGVKADLFTFFQRIPETKPNYNYYMEWESVAVIPIISFDHWWQNQIKKNTRQAIKRSEKMEVQVRLVEFNDELVKGIKQIYDESPIRQGRPFPHYRKDFNSLKKYLATYPDRNVFIGAYYKGELIGFIKLTDEKNFMDIMFFLSKIQHRDKAPTNALLAKAVEICAERKIPYLEYGTWSRRGLDDFKRHNGFERVGVPRYYIPLTFKGRIAMGLNLHHGISGILPDGLANGLIELRKKWYQWKYKKVFEIALGKG
jgi:hypothetical protein